MAKLFVRNLYTLPVVLSSYTAIWSGSGYCTEGFKPVRRISWSLINPVDLSTSYILRHNETLPKEIAQDIFLLKYCQEHRPSHSSQGESSLHDIPP